MGKVRYFDSISDYVEGNMTEIETKKFESNLQNDTELKAEYDAYLAAEIAVKAFGYEILSQKRKKSKPVIKMWLAIAATILFLIVGCTWYANSNYATPVLIAEGLVEPNFSSFRGDGNSDVLAEATNAFYSNKFGKVEEILSNVLVADTAYISAQFILGHALMESGDYDKALKSFALVSNHSQTRFAANARWSEILSLVAVERYEEAYRYLQPLLSNPSNEYHEKALQLNQGLNRFWRKFVF